MSCRKNNKIKIVYQVAPYVVGGTERFLLGLTSCLDKKAFEVLVYSWDEGPVIDAFRRARIKTKIINTRKADGLSKLKEFLRRNKINIAQSNNFYPDLAMAAYSHNIPHIWAVGGHINICLRNSKASRRSNFLRWVEQLSKLIICHSKFLAGQFEGIRQDKIKIIYHGTFIPRIKNPQIRRKRNACFKIGMPAHLIAQKRHVDFINAAAIVLKKFPFAKFFIIGAAYPQESSLKYAKGLHKKAKKLGVTKNIIFTGHVENPLRLMAQLDIVVLPSINEGSSNSIIEAMALGKPVVASDSGGNPELVINNITGKIIPIKSPEKLAGAINGLLSDIKKAQSLGLYGYQRAKRLFNIKDIAKKYEVIYRKLNS